MVVRTRGGDTFGYGLIGCGTFGRFCLEHYADLDDIVAVAAADVDPNAVQVAADRFGLAACASIDELLSRDDVDVVHIATPPITHKDLALAALNAGKHVLCEKPLATNLDDARAMLAAARSANKVLAVNLIMRYDPLCQAVKRILDDGLLGEPLHAFFENYAGDEPLTRDHWFWKRPLSGGIFIEHGVHFFDLFRMWFGPGRVLAAQQSVRPNSDDVVEQASCTVRYGTTLLVNFYHGFHQAARMDRQEIRIVCERGSISLFEWVPTRIKIDCRADRATLDALKAVVPHPQAEQCESYTTDQRRVTSRHKSYAVDGRFLIRGDTGMSKLQLYGHVLRSLLADQLNAIRSSAHQRLVSEENGLTSLEMAVCASELTNQAP